jgi:hypothetical protein
MNYHDGDIVLYKDDTGIYYDIGILTNRENGLKVIQFKPFYGKTCQDFPQIRRGYDVYRYVGRKDNKIPDEMVAKEAITWINKWNKYRYSTWFWILLSRVPILRHWISHSNDKAKIFADYGFTSSTAIAWAYECSGVDLVPCRSPDITSVGDLTRCALLRQLKEGEIHE